MARTSGSSPPSGLRSRRTRAVAVAGGFVVIISLALPRMMSTSGGVEPVLSREGRTPPPQQETALLRDRLAAMARIADASDSGGSRTTRGGTRQTTTKRGPAERIAVERVTRAADDLNVAVSLRWPSYPTGTPIAAQVEIANCDETPVWIPAPDDPHRTLSIRVLDATGATVRHVVEDTAGRLPRNMTRLGPGETATITLDVVARGEEPLPPGRYELTAVFEADKAWLRTGLPVWTAPKGARHSGRVAFEVTAR